MESHIVEARLARLEKRCGAEGVPLTPQRRVVMEVLAPRTDHPTVEQIYTQVSTRLPGVSKATVYRSLETMLDLGLLTKVHHPGSAVRFDPNTAPHHHFLCQKCERVWDLPLPAVRGYAELEFESADGLSAQEITVWVRGVCGECSRG